MPQPVSPLAKATVAVVSRRVGGVPSFARVLESAMEKQAAWAAASSSSGLVRPACASVREDQETGRSRKAGLVSVETRPAPPRRSPSHVALARLISSVTVTSFPGVTGEGPIVARPVPLVPRPATRHLASDARSARVAAMARRAALVWVCFLVAIAVAACQATASPVPTASPTATAAATSPAATAPASPAETPAPTSTGAPTTPPAATATPTPTEKETPMVTPAPFTLASDAFREGEAIPRRYTCDGADVSPALSWAWAPADTKAYALVMDDPDAPGGLWIHWVVYDLPADTTDLPEGVPPTGAGAPPQGPNDFGRVGWGGPCPPSGTHRYVFWLYALSEPLGLSGSPTAAQVRSAAKPVTLATTKLIGTYHR